jgi:hypothetical protein
LWRIQTFDLVSIAPLGSSPQYRSLPFRIDSIGIVVADNFFAVSP